MAGQQITGLTVEGYKSFGKKQHLQIRPLTLLAGANSSGKSSVIQPLLLLKQTLDAPFDPGPLKIDGPNVAFSWNRQLFTQGVDGETVPSMKIGLKHQYWVLFSRETSQRTLELEFKCTPEGKLILMQESIGELCSQCGEEKYIEIKLKEGKLTLASGQNATWLEQSLRHYTGLGLLPKLTEWDARVVRVRCFLDLEIEAGEIGSTSSYADIPISLSRQLGPLFANIMYIPGLRDPASVRSYPRMPIGEYFSGPMHPYLASIIHDWGQGSEPWEALEQDLRSLGLAEKVAVEAVNDTALEVLVGRRLPSGRHAHPDLVSLADVGLGLSQVMPILVVLRAAQPHHVVVIEQPELHLHPRGIHKLAEVIVDAVNRGVRIIMETHSELLLLGVQTMVAQGRLDSTQVSLNWFSLDEQGYSHIHQAEIEQDGSFGDWPVDFLDVELSAQRQYLDAVSNHG